MNTTQQQTYDVVACLRGRRVECVECENLRENIKMKENVQSIKMSAKLFR
jgi:hypothetical protein